MFSNRSPFSCIKRELHKMIRATFRRERKNIPRGSFRFVCRFIATRCQQCGTFESLAAIGEQIDICELIYILKFTLILK